MLMNPRPAAILELSGESFGQRDHVDHRDQFRPKLAGAADEEQFSLRTRILINVGLAIFSWAIVALLLKATV
jgi:hypothetical protein